ncbi:hypothetical protein TWF694_003519 [Orbilia ellipsospora]|uniref:F-box domain-containing protein n=1 Tax=Orbilia ellipsospora TaxID=2528407 RepID=A0AAV9X0M7_9PEZI
MATLITLTTLPSAFRNILQRLKHREVFFLLLTCKSLHSVSYPYLWEHLDLSSYDDYINKSKTCSRLSRILKTKGAENIGLLKHTKEITLPGNCFSPEGDFVKTGLIEIFRGLIESGKLGLIAITLSFDYSKNDKIFTGTPEVKRFLNTLKKYSKSKTPEEFRIYLLTSNLAIPPVLALFDLEKVNTLWLHMAYSERDIEKALDDSDDDELSEDDLSDDENDGVNENSGDEYSGSLGSDEYRDMGNADRSFKNTKMALLVASLIKGVTNVQNICISSSSDISGGYYTDLKMSDALREVQSAFKGLKYLLNLEIVVKFFHPSLFIAPPESTRRVKYRGPFSNVWWRDFAIYPFTNVEHMILTYDTFPSKSTKRCKSDYTPKPIKLNEVAIQTLKTISTQNCEYAVADLAACIVKRNKSLGLECQKELISNYTYEFHSRTTGKFSPIRKRVEQWVQDEYTGRFLGGTEEEETSTASRSALRALIGQLGEDDIAAWFAARERAANFAADCSNWLENEVKTVVGNILEQRTAEITLQPQHAAEIMEPFFSDCLEQVITRATEP